MTLIRLSTRAVQRTALPALLATTLLLASGSALAAAQCAGLDGCAAKACRIDAQLEQAKAAGNTKQIAGLEKARVETQHCSDDGLKAKRQAALAQAQKRIDQRTTELTAAQATNNPAKIKKAQKKLDNAQSVYKELQASPL